jgi:pantoate--beta-alanine ligase
LLRAARRAHAAVIASIFVNPLQFGSLQDLATYPRDERRDLTLAEAEGVDLVFAPTEEEMYPPGDSTRVTPGPLASVLEGASRPGHFEGVATVVAKLLNIVSPHAAIFGKKDYQQLLVLRDLVRQLNFDVKVVPGETVRDPDGLAMSSRNGYLSAAEREEAVSLSRVLRSIREAVAGGRRDFADLEKAARDELAARGWRPDYIAVRRSADLGTPGADDRDLVVLGAAWIGRTRLTDNMPLAWDVA